LLNITGEQVALKSIEAVEELESSNANTIPLHFELGELISSLLIDVVTTRNDPLKEESGRVFSIVYYHVSNATLSLSLRNRKAAATAKRRGGVSFAPSVGKSPRAPSAQKDRGGGNSTLASDSKSQFKEQTTIDSTKPLTFILQSEDPNQIVTSTKLSVITQRGRAVIEAFTFPDDAEPGEYKFVISDETALDSSQLISSLVIPFFLVPVGAKKTQR
jgi:hypothetical protein